MKKLIFLLFFSAFLMPTTAFAYIDANTISMILQAIVGGIVGFLVFIKYNWQRVKKILFRRMAAKVQIDKDQAK